MGAKSPNVKRKINGNSFLLLITIVLFFAMYIAGVIIFHEQGFGKVQNFLNLFISNAGLIVIASGMTVVMITGGIDISVGSVVALTCMVLAWTMEVKGMGAIMATVLVLVFVMLRYTKFGRSIYAVGGNEQSALLMGLNVKRTKLKAYVLSSTLCGLGGFLFCLNTCAGFVEQAKGLEMDAIASAVIGGTLLTGGVGNVFGSLFGVLIKGTIEAFITFQGTLSSW